MNDPGDHDFPLQPLTPEEYEKSVELTREQIERAFKKGREDMDRVRRKPKGRY